MVRQWKFKTSQKHLDKLLQEATVDCYDEYEAFMGVVVTLGENLPFPFEAKAIGETVEVIGIDDSRSDVRCGIIAKVRKGGSEYGVAFSELDVPTKLKSNKWFEMYEYWKRGYWQ
jgi:Calcium binding